MQIELLWIIPIVSFTVFIGIVIYFAQKKSLNTDLKKEVINFNSGATVRNMNHRSHDGRIDELEKAISYVTNSISSQQSVLDKFKHDNKDATSELNDLKDKLRELYKEYDIVLSENYSLRAKMKKLLETKKNSGSPEIPADFKEELENVLRTDTENTINKVENASESSKPLDLKLYEDTRLLNISGFDDIDIANTKSKK